MNDLYRDNILDHCKRPHNKGSLPDADCKGSASNLFCGDRISISLKIRNGKIEKAMFDGYACAICTASASMLTDEVKGKSFQSAKKMGGKRVLELLGIEPGPARLKCALLPLEALKGALCQHVLQKGGGKK